MSTTSRLFCLFGSAVFHRRTPHFISVPAPQVRLPNHLFRSSIRFHRYSSSASVLDSTSSTSTDTDTADPLSHPWPEWVSFVDRLKTKGYLTVAAITDSSPSTVEQDTNGEGAGDVAVYTDMNILKDACLNFARDRFDIFKSLSKQDIQTVVETGCPNLFRKAVNSAKRLRAYVLLDEGDVCSVCTLRGSCDRAYVILKDFEAGPRTVDIVRILLLYALDPLVISGGEKPPGRELVEVSARKLLSELIELSETTPDPELPKPEVPANRASGSKQNKKALNFVDEMPSKRSSRQDRNSFGSADDGSRNIEMKRGDWMCSQCNFMNFARNTQCRKCGEDGPKKVDGEGNEVKPGDWVCSECDFMNFSRNVRCLKCKAEGPKKVAVNDREMKKGDWNCEECGFMNFASKKTCLRCRGPRPKRPLNPGEWECPSCDFLNFRANTVCKKCNCDRPKGTDSQLEDQIWKKPY